MMDLGFTDIVVRLILGLVIGFCIGLTGVGGGALVMPSLTVVLGLPASVAVGTASFYAFLTKIYATYRHFKLKNVDVSISVPFLVGAVPGTAAVALWINWYVKNTDAHAIVTFQHGLKNFIAAVILSAGIVMVLNLMTKARQAGEHGKTLLAAKLADHLVARRILAALMGLAVGALIGATSVGGGVLIVPLLIIFFGLSSKRTVGSSIFIAVVLTLVSSLVYGRGSQVDWLTAVIMAVGSVTGVYWGSRLSVKMPERLLQCVVIAMIFFAAILMLFKQAH